MEKILLSNKIFYDEDKAIEYLQDILWPDGPVCPHCGNIGKAYKLKGNSTRKGLLKCKTCRKPFTVRMKTLFEDSPLSIHKWLMATYLLCSSKKGFSSKQLERNLGITYKTAWFLSHRIR